MATTEQLLDSLMMGFDRPKLSPLVVIKGGASIQSGYYAEPGTKYIGVDDDTVIHYLDGNPRAQLELDVSSQAKATGITGTAIVQTLDITKCFPADALSEFLVTHDVTGLDHATALYLGSFIRVKNPRDNAQSNVTVTLEYVSLASGRPFCDAGNLSNITTGSVDANPRPKIQITLTPDSDGVCEAFVGPYDLKGIKTKFYSPAIISSEMGDGAEGRTFTHRAKVVVTVTAINSADITFHHSLSTVPAAFVKGCIALHKGWEVINQMTDQEGSVTLYQASVDDNVTASDIWDLVSGGALEQGFLDTLLS